MSDNKSNQYIEDLLESIQLLINNSLAKLPKDNTEVCRITDTSEREQGHYKVSIDGVTIYDAYSEKTTYTKDEQVVVLFPKDDTQKKTILSRYIANDTESMVAYVSPRDQYVQVSANLANGLSGAINANDSQNTEVKLNQDRIQLSEDTSLFNAIY